MRTLKHISILLLLIILPTILGTLTPTVTFSQSKSTYRVVLPLIRTSPAANPSLELVSSEFTQEEQQTTQALVTKELLREAKPMPLLTINRAEFEALQETAVPQGEPGSVEGEPPDPQLLALAQQIYAEDWQAMKDGTKLGNGSITETLPISMTQPDTIAPASFWSYYVNYYTDYWTVYPFSTMGRLFFTNPDGYWYSCSASVVLYNTILTAGHCVYTPGRGGHSNFIFVPAYRDGAAPFGYFYGSKAVVLGGWAYYGWYSSDIGMVSLANDGWGYSVGEWVGWLYGAWNQSTYQYYYAFGYPAGDHPNGGRFLVACESYPVYEGWVVEIGCDQAPGSSGGPWLIWFSWPYYYYGGYVNGVFSYYYPGYNVMGSAYFGDGARVLYEWAYWLVPTSKQAEHRK